MASIRFTSMNVFNNGEFSSSLYDRESFPLPHNSSAESVHDAMGQLPPNRSYTDKSAAQNHVRSSFTLCRPVLNYVLAGNNGARIYWLLGLAKKDMEDICSFRRIYDCKEHKLVSIDAACDQHLDNVMVGGEFLLYLINNVDFKARAEAVIIGVANSLINNDRTYLNLIGEHRFEEIVVDNGGSQRVKYKVIMEFEESLERSNDGVKFGAGLRLKPMTGDYEDGLNEFLNAVAQYIDNNINKFKYLIRLLAMPDEEARDLLRSMFFYEMIVPPIKMRPRFGTRSYDQMENSFVEVYLANNNLSYLTDYRSDTLKDYINAYSTLWKKVSALTYKHVKENRVALLERFKGKKGILRGTNLAKRMDYSGRSVIIVDPKLSMDTIRIPQSSAEKIYKLRAIKKGCEAEAGKVDHPYTPRMICHSPTIKDRTSSLIKSSHEFFTGPTAPKVAIGRQPTLHKGSITSYNVETTPGNAIMLSPLICPAFNADFDGDTMWYTIPLTDGAEVEVSTLLFGPNNMFWAKDGNPTITPRQEIIYGLNQCTLSKHTNDAIDAVDYNGYGRHHGVYRKNISTLADAYNAVLHNKARIYDTANVGNHNGVYVGRLAFLHCIEGSGVEFKLNRCSVVKCVCPDCAYEQDIREYSANEVHYCPYCKTTEMIPITTVHGYDCPCCGTSFDPWSAHKAVLENKDNKPISLIVQKGHELVNKLNGYSDYKTALTNYTTAQHEANALRRIVRAMKTMLELYPDHKQDIIDILQRDVTMLDKVRSVNITADMSLTMRADIERKNHLADVASALYKYYAEFPDKYKVLTVITASVPDVLKEGSGILSYYRSRLDKMKELAVELRSVYQNHSSIFDMLDKLSYECHNCSYGDHGATITNKNISFFVKKLLIASGESNIPDNKLFVNAINKMVALGFAVAKQYAPTLNVLQDISFEAEFAKFRGEIEDIKRYYDDGYVSEEEFNSKYSKALEALDKSIEKAIADRLTENSGFLKMVQSGARGSMRNLILIYAYKGQVQKNSTESFNAVIEHSYVQQLSPIEGFMAAYGSRRGIMDRSLVTADTGYVSRQLWHACQGAVITSIDCGATEADTITLDRSTLKSVINAKPQDLDSLLIGFYNGRYGFVDGKEEFINSARARELVKNNVSVKLRSPLTCRDPFCAKCYGIDMSTWNQVVVGTPVGIVAAEAIGETTSQLTMRTFQGGGVAGKGGIGSAFDKTKMYIGVNDVFSKSANTYEPVAWKTGDVIIEEGAVKIVSDTEIPMPMPTNRRAELVNGTLKSVVKKGEDLCTVPCGVTAWADGRVARDMTGRVVIYVTKPIAYSCPNKNWVADKNAPLKHHVVEGEGLYTTPGDKDLNELLTHAGLTNAQLYLALKLHSIYKSECLISLKHFEILVASMTRGKVLRTRTPELNIGCYYTKKELLKIPHSEDTYISWEFKPIDSIPATENDCVANIDFEDPSIGLFDALMFDRKCSFENPIESIVFGLKPKVGEAINPNYIYERTGSNRVQGSGVRYNAPRGDVLL